MGHARSSWFLQPQREITDKKAAWLLVVFIFLCSFQAKLVLYVVWSVWHRGVRPEGAAKDWLTVAGRN